MRGNLDSLIRLHAWRLEETRRALAEAKSLLEDLEAGMTRLINDLAGEQEQARKTPSEAGTAYGGYARLVIDRRARLSDSIASAEANVARRHDDMADSYRRLRVLEIARQNRRNAERESIARRQQRVADDLTLARFRREGDGR